MLNFIFSNMFDGTVVRKRRIHSFISNFFIFRGKVNIFLIAPSALSDMIFNVCE